MVVYSLYYRTSLSSHIHPSVCFTTNTAGHIQHRRSALGTSTRTERIWKYTNTPFELCPKAYRFHTCAWQVFDGNKAGCIRCSYIHVCGRGECPLVQTEDAMVCEITGLCVQCQNFMPDDYSDCIAYMGPSTTADRPYVDRDLVYECVYGILCTPTAEVTRTMMQRRFIEKLKVCVTRQGALSGQTNLIDLISDSVASVRRKHTIPTRIQASACKYLADVCTEHICVLINIGHSRLQINVKQNDVRNTVIGLIYMMRFGVYVHDIVVLPRFKVLRYILPPENILLKNFGCRCKIITETENKYKIHIRQAPVNDLRNMGFMTRRQEETLQGSWANFLAGNSTGQDAIP